MKQTKKTYTIMTFLCLLILAITACSDKDDPTPQGTHFVQVKPLIFGMENMSNIKFFVSEQPFESYDTFKPLSSTDFPEDYAAGDVISVDVSAGVGKTVYITAMRKYLLSDRFYNLTPESDTQKRSNLKVQVEDGVSNYELPNLFVMQEPEDGSYPQDIAKVTITVKDGSTPLANESVRQYGYPSYLWSDEFVPGMESALSLGNTDVAFRNTKEVGTTDGKGQIHLEFPIDETFIDNNSYVFFTVDNDLKIRHIKVELTSLDVRANIAY